MTLSALSLYKDFFSIAIDIGTGTAHLFKATLKMTPNNHVVYTPRKNRNPLLVYMVVSPSKSPFFLCEPQKRNLFKVPLNCLTNQAGIQRTKAITEA